MIYTPCDFYLLRDGWGMNYQLPKAHNSFPKHKSVFQNTNQFHKTQINVKRLGTILLWSRWPGKMSDELGFRVFCIQYGDYMSLVQVCVVLVLLRCFAVTAAVLWRILLNFAEIVEIPRPITLKLVLPRPIRSAVGKGELNVLQLELPHII